MAGPLLGGRTAIFGAYNMNTDAAALKRLDIKIDRRIWPMIMMAGFFAVLVVKEVQWPSVVLAVFTGVGLLGLFMTGVQYPSLPFYVLVVYLPFSRELVGDFGTETTALNLTNFLMALVLLSHIMRKRLKPEVIFPSAPLSKFVWIFCILGAAALARAGFQYGSWYVLEYIVPLKRWLTPIFLYFIALWVVQEKKNWKAAVVLIMVAVAVVGAMAAWDYFQEDPHASLERTRVRGIAGNPNTLGAFFNYYMFLILGFFLVHTKGPRRLLLLLPFLICFRGIMVTFSRGAYLAFAAGCLAAAWFRNKALFALTVGLLALVIAHPTVLPPGIRYRLGMTLQQRPAYGDDAKNVLEASAARRVDIWRGAIAMIKDHPWTGVGYGAFPSYIGPYTGGKVEFMDAHNSYLLIASEMGLPTLAWFLLILTVIAYYTRRLYRRTDDKFIKATALGFLTGLCALIVANFFGSRIDSAEVIGYFWILCGLMMRAVLMERQETRDRKQETGRSVRQFRQTVNSVGYVRPKLLS